jgi:hypothetical protein
MSERAPEDILKGIAESEADEALERVTAMSDGERRRELEAAGVDLRGLRAAADTLYAELRAGRSDEEPTSSMGISWRARPKARERRPAWLWALALLGAILLALLFFADLLHAP